MQERLNKAPLFEHIVELRTRLLRALSVLAAIFLVLAPFANKLYDLFSLPISEKLSLVQSEMISTTMVGPLLIPYKLVFYIAILLASPYLLVEIWGFIKPGLYNKERRLILPLLFFSCFLFYLGILVGYQLILPLYIDIIIKFMSLNTIWRPDIGSYLDFSLKFFLGFGLVFEIPVLLVLLVKTNLVSVERLVTLRGYVIVGAFLIGMLLTPPDIISQLMLAIPIWIFYESGILICRLLQKSKEKPG